MKLEFTNDELFVLCALGGCEEVIGIANPFIAIPEEEIQPLVNVNIERLKGKGYIFKGNNGYTLSDESTLIVELLSNSYKTFIIVDDNNEKFVFMNKKKSMYMENVDFINCSLEVFDNFDEIKLFFRSEFGFFKAHTDTIQYMLSIPSDIIDVAIGKVKENEMEEAIKILDGDDFEIDEMKNMLASIIYPEYTKIVIFRKKINDEYCETIFRFCGNENGTWIVKISTSDDGNNTMVYKATDDDITKVIFEV